ncbi:sensor histidine kinase [Parapedobacter sp. DT-150]|uniref:sensor histidine kinase n=1 Tax=Parapedobacter sp. DT-150 TaxID=3396162 RepID=UPI003F195AC3
MGAISRGLHNTVLCWCLLICSQIVTAQERLEETLIAKFDRLTASALNEERFQSTCSVIDRMEEYDAVVGMKYTNRLIAIVRPMNRRKWMHALLTNKYEVAQLVYPFRDSAAAIVRELQRNAGDIQDIIFRQTMVYSVHAYMQAGSPDLADEFAGVGIQVCTAQQDSLNLAMLYALKAELLYKQQADSVNGALEYAWKAQAISKGLTNKTALFTSSYSAAHIAYVNNPAKLVAALEQLIPLSKDSSLIKQHFHDQTFFTFAKPDFTIYLDLMRLNLVLMDIPSARRMYQVIEATLLARKRKTGILNNRSLGMLVSDRAVIEAFAGSKRLTGELLDSCRAYFAPLPETDIPSINYFLARALWNEMNAQYPAMLKSLEILKSKYVGAVLPLSLTTLFAHAYALNGYDERARVYFDRAAGELNQREYSVAGYYHYQYYADWLYRKENYRAYAGALKTFYSIKDSIANIRQMRDISNIQAQRYVKERDLEIAYLKKIQETDDQMNRLIRGGGLTVLAVLILAIALLYSRNLQRRKSNLILQEKNDRIKTLIRELHHRVKNNLQVISSLLSLQSLKMEEGAARQAVAEGQRRVESMALIHQKLYQHEDITGVDMKAYIHDLLQHIVYGFGVADIELKIDVEAVLMDIDTAVPLGLIINELVTNSLKHGIGKKGGDQLSIGLYNREDGYHVTVADSGPGLPEGFDITSSPSFGLKLVAELVRQLQATIRWEGGGGASVDLIVPKS